MKRQSILIGATLPLLMLTALAPGNASGGYTVEVKADTPTTATTFLLELGKTYQIESRTYYIYNSGHGNAAKADAEWHRHYIYGNWLEYYWDISDPDVHKYDLLVNGVGYDWLGTTDGVNFAPHTYSPSHVYRINIAGTGDVATFGISNTKFATWMSGSLEVEISELPPIPAPSAVLLGSLGIGFVTWLRRRKML